MGRKGKKHRKFVDKNDPNTHTFALIHRSQHDPRIADSEASPFVLHPVESYNASRRKRREERDANASTHRQEADLPDMGIPILREEEQRHGRPRLQPRSAPSHHAQESQYDDNDDDDDELDDLGEGMGDNPEVYGIYYHDEYDYMQHLREPGTSGADTYFVDEQSRFEFLSRQGVAKHANLDLPAELLPSVGEEEIGLLNRAAPRSGPQLDLDPDVVAALDEDEKAVEDNAEGAGDYEDYLNLVLRGDGDEYVDGDDDDDYDGRYAEYEDDDEGERTPRASDNEADSEDGHLAVSDDDDDGDHGAEGTGHGHPTTASGETSYDDIWREIAHGTRGSASAGRARTEVKSRFTEYSMSSSVIPRSEALQHIDQGFEIFYEKYDDENIGGLDEIADEADLTISESDIKALEEETAEFCDEMRKRGLMKDKQLSYAKERQRMREEDLKERRAKAGDAKSQDVNARTTPAAEKDEQEQGRATPTANAPLSDDGAGDNDEEDADDVLQNETVVMVVPGKAKERREWDCESVLSLRSTLYNHPAVIDERGRSRKRGQRNKQQQQQQQGPDRIQIDPKTGIPVEGLALIGRGRKESDDSDSDSDVPAVNEGQPRPKKETKEEKKARKKAIKELRQARRAQKKQTKQAFKDEIKRQQKMHEV